MGVTNSNKQTDVTRIDCDGEFRVTLALTAAPDITANPVDIALVLDRSSSMAGTALANMKAGAKTFIDIIAEATGGSSTILGGSRIGIVSFATTATQDTPLITSVATLKSAVDDLTADGRTNHADAFTKAGALFSASSTNAKVLVIFTDGNTTAGLPPAPVAASLRAAGVTIYAIGLIGSNGVDPAALNEWATDPDASHVAVTPDAADLEQLFADLAANITKPGATNIVIDETVNPDFAIVSILQPTKGMATMINARALRWTISSLGTTASEGASLEFVVRHIGQTSGLKAVNESVAYSDDEHNTVTFPNPTITVDCGSDVFPESCPEPQDISIDGCEDALIVDAGDTYLNSQGRILQVSTTLKNVCPGKRVALAAILTEVDTYGNEYPRGTKTMTIPAHNHPTCRDIEVRCIKFVLPEDLNTTCTSNCAMCSPRKLKIRFISHFIDSDFQCCEAVVRCI